VSDPADRIQLSDLHPQMGERFMVSRVRNRFFVELPKLSINPLSQDLQRSSEDDIKRRNLPRSKHMNNSDLKIDVLVITALPMEMNELIKCKDLPGSPDADWEPLQDSYDYTYYTRLFHRNDGSSFTVAAATSQKMGERAATSAATRLATQLRPKCLAMTGICAGNRREVKLGDLIIADKVFDVDFGKLIAFYDERGVRESEILHDITTYNLNPVWRDRINNLDQNPIPWVDSISQENPRPKPYASQESWLLCQLYNYQKDSLNHVHPNFHPEKNTECPSWGTVLDRLWEKKLLIQGELELALEGRKFAEKVAIRGHDEKVPENPQVHLGPIGTGKQVQRDPKLFKALEKIQCRTLGVEMEGNAIGAVADDLQIDRMIVVKGVSDYGDDDKDNQFQKYAAESSARFLIAFLKEHLPCD
jgi:nucleoside phosphorylase